LGPSPKEEGYGKKCSIGGGSQGRNVGNWKRSEARLTPGIWKSEGGGPPGLRGSSKKKLAKKKGGGEMVIRG